MVRRNVIFIGNHFMSKCLRGSKESKLRASLTSDRLHNTFGISGGCSLRAIRTGIIVFTPCDHIHLVPTLFNPAKTSIWQKQASVWGPDFCHNSFLSIHQMLKKHLLEYMSRVDVACELTVMCLTLLLHPDKTAIGTQEARPKVIRGGMQYPMVHLGVVWRCIGKL